MRITRIILILAFLAVGAVYAVQNTASRISVADEPPVLSCGSDTLEISVHAEDDILLADITASDPQDGDISDRVLVTGVSRLISDNTAKISYAVFDSDHNMATLTRYIRYTDYQLPRFSLAEPLIYTVGQEIRLLDRLRAGDVLDGDITDSIRVTSAGVMDQPGIHDVSVQVTNTMGDTAWLTLPVIILEKDGGDIEVDLDTYLLYLNRGDSFDARRYLNGASFRGDSVSTGNVSISGEVDTGTPGTYRVEYTCVYGSYSGTAILTVVVE